MRTLWKFTRLKGIQVQQNLRGMLDFYPKVCICILKVEVMRNKGSQIKLRTPGCVVPFAAQLQQLHNTNNLSCAKEKAETKGRDFFSSFPKIQLLTLNKQYQSERSWSMCNFLTLDVVAIVSPYYGCKYRLDKSTHPRLSLEILCEKRRKYCVKNKLRFQKGIRIQTQISMTRPGSSGG